MGRWQAGTRERLKRAALELFVKQGFAPTTVPQITARAGLTTRTFFRHFADKREVLFDGEEELPALIADLIARAPASLSPIEVLADGLEPYSAAVLDGRRDDLRIRRAVIDTDDGLRERELHKRATLSAAISGAFAARGSDALTATLAAELTVTVFSVALARWLDHDDDQKFADIAAEVLHALRDVAGGSASAASRVGEASS